MTGPSGAITFVTSAGCVPKTPKSDPLAEWALGRLVIERSTCKTVAASRGAPGW